MALKLVRGINQIVDMNQKSQYAQSFKFILQKIYFDQQTSEFVSEMRHSIVHKEFPSTPNIRRFATILLNWCFYNFWKPLLLNNLKKFNAERLRLLMPFFFRAVQVKDSQILKAFDKLVPFESENFDNQLTSLFEVKIGFWRAEAFNEKIKQLIHLRLPSSKKLTGNQKLFQIAEIDEENYDHDEADSPREAHSKNTPKNEKEILDKLEVCLNPNAENLKR